MLHLKIDRAFKLMLTAPIPLWMALYWHQATEVRLDLGLLIIMALMYPAVEEFLFRGIIQPIIAKKTSTNIYSLSLANIITSIIFAITHLINHDPLWAAATILPSLLFGFCLDRYKTLQAPIALHCYYNAGYFLLTGM